MVVVASTSYDVSIYVSQQTIRYPRLHFILVEIVNHNLAHYEKVQAFKDSHTASL